MLRLLRFLIILVVYLLLIALISFLAFGYLGAGVVILITSITLGFYFFYAHNLLTGFFSSKRLSEVFYGSIYSDCRNEFFRLGVPVPKIYQYESSECNSVMLSSIFGSSHILLSSELVKSSAENIKSHFAYAVIKQKYFPSSRVESLVGAFGLFNIHLINLVTYPFTVLSESIDIQVLGNIRKLFLFLFVPLFGIIKRIVLGVNKNNKVYEKMIETNIDRSDLIDSLMKANSSFNSNLFELDLIEYNKFLSVSFNAEESEFAF